MSDEPPSETKYDCFRVDCAYEESIGVEIEWRKEYVLIVTHMPERITVS